MYNKLSKDTSRQHAEEYCQNDMHPVLGKVHVFYYEFSTCASKDVKPNFGCDPKTAQERVIMHSPLGQDCACA